MIDAMGSYAAKEKGCEMSFRTGGPYWHAYTSGKETPILFSTKEEMSFAMNVIAQGAYAFQPASSLEGQQVKGLVLISFALMNNHFHFVASGSAETVRAFFSFCRKRLSRTIPRIKSVEIYLKEIDSLASLRNIIVYTNRNGYVADPNHTPFSYPWGAGRYYFNDIPVFQHYSDILVGSRRLMFRGRDPDLPEEWPLTDGYIAPPAYCAIRFGMSVFRDAHHYFSAVCKNVEAYADVAAELNDSEFLTDTELFARVLAYVRDQYGVNGLRDLTNAQKHDLARVLHYDYRSSNGQIHRILGLSLYEINSLFPLSAQ